MDVGLGWELRARELRRRQQELEQGLGQIRAYAEAWADPDSGDAILAIIDRLAT